MNLPRGLQETTLRLGDLFDHLFNIYIRVYVFHLLRVTQKVANHELTQRIIPPSRDSVNGQ